MLIVGAGTADLGSISERVYSLVAHELNFRAPSTPDSPLADAMRSRPENTAGKEVRPHVGRSEGPKRGPVANAHSEGALMTVEDRANGMVRLFRALDGKTGRVLWQQSLGGRIDDATSVYSVGGKGYVLIAPGGSSVGGTG
jgi:hypothetical protein